MENIRLAARNHIQNATDADGELGLFEVDTNFSISLHNLWTDVNSHHTQDAQEDVVIENLLMIQHVFKNWNHEVQLNEHDKNAAWKLYNWLAETALPSSEFASVLEARYSANEEKDSELSPALKTKQTIYTIAISCIKYFNGILSVLEVSSVVEVLISIMSFTSLHDPWTTNTSLNDALAVLQSSTEPQNWHEFSVLLGDIWESRIRPMFNKSKNAALAKLGRKNLHPLPQPRFDDSLFDPKNKPWKYTDVYMTTVLESILAQYSRSGIKCLESQFYFYIPPILSLIDDESASFKYRGCNLLIKFLTPIQASDSDLLRDTNLSSVFQDAVAPCLLSLPTITSEAESLHLLGVAYPALLLTLQTRYHINSGRPPIKDEDRQIYINDIIKILRDNVISSFHHVSSYTPASATEDSSSLASFPYPRLSTFLLDQLRTLIREIGIHITKHLQEIVPIIYSTLTNSFGTAYIPLLLAGIATAQALILNAHPRIWRFGGDLLAAICQCWTNVSHDESSTSDLEQKRELRQVMYKLQGSVYLLKLSVQGAVATENEENLYLTDVDDEKDVDIEHDVEVLVEADEQLKELLEVDTGANLDDDYFI